VLDSCAAGMMKLLASMDLSHSSTLKLRRLKKASASLVLVGREMTSG